MKKETKYLISYGLSGGFGGADKHEVESFSTSDEAETYAWRKACESYEDVEGRHGIRTLAEIMEEEELSEEEAQQSYSEERESWLDYAATIYDESKHKELLND